MSTITLFPATAPLSGTLEIPGDKSISHRSIIFAALSNGTSRITHLLEGEDVLCTIDCFRKLGVSIEKKDGVWTVHGVGLSGLKAPTQTLYCGNSGTTMRLMMGVLAAQPFTSTLSGDASLSRRPMGRVMKPLEQMGARFLVEHESTPDRLIHVEGGNLKGIDYESPVASAQIKSALLLAGLWATGSTTVREPALSRDHTERMLAGSGVSLQRTQNTVTVFSQSELLFHQSFQNCFEVPGDISSAAFFLIAGAIVPGSKLLLKNVGLNPSRTGILDVLKDMGAELEVRDPRVQAGEEVGDLFIQASRLAGTDSIADNMIPRLIDEIPVLAVAAARATGKTTIRDAKELKVKESNRIEVLVNLLVQLGVSATATDDGLVIVGPSEFLPATVQSRGDHRMAMSMAVASLVAKGPIVIEDIDCVQTSFPTFWDCLKQIQ